MDQNVPSMSEKIVESLRRITRSMDLHSRSLVQSHGLTGPQATLLNSLTRGPMTAGELANRINLSQGTVTDILNRLEARGLVTRVRDGADKRRVIVTLTTLGEEILKKSLPLIQALFSERLKELPEWEQSQLLSALQRIAHMMEGGATPEALGAGAKKISSLTEESGAERPATAA
ncbi:MAG: MarR family winged helix-turn-helix transcriptional regulator [Gammaproteobacteria bacterium]|nr:winged helix-turn-helix transcriptional regulator [Pseudomonadales bacterium]